MTFFVLWLQRDRALMRQALAVAAGIGLAVAGDKMPPRVKEMFEGSA